MSVFEDLKAMMDAQVDNHLGDSITYRRNGVPIARAAGDPTIPGHLNNLTNDGGFDGMQPQQDRWTLKIRKTFIPDGPRLADVITAAKLGGISYRPGASAAADDGAYWIVDLQKAPA